MADSRIQSYMKAFSNLVKQKLHKEKKPPSEEEAETENYAGDAGDDKPGEQSMNGGTHKKPRTIRRKLIGIAMLLFVVAFAASYLVSSDEDTKGKDQNPIASHSTAQETKNPFAKGEAGKQNELSYKDLRTLDQKNQNPRQASAQAAQAGQNGENPAAQPARTGAYPSSTPRSTPPSVPSIPAPTYSAGAPVIASPAAAPAMPSAQTQESKAQRAADEMEKRFASAIDFALGRSPAASQPAAGADHAPAGNAVVPTSAQAPAPTSNSLQTASLSYATGNPYTLQAGTTIPAMLFSGINTDAPGQVTAQVTADVYDTLSQRNVLIPVGSRLLGEYEGGGAESGRIAVTFRTLILPNGDAYDIGSSMVAVDGAGYNGITGKVHRHTMRQISAGMFSSAIAALGSLASGDSSSQNSYTGGQIAMQGAMANLINSTSQLFSKAAGGIKPTVTIEPGYQFTIYVKQPITFASGV